MRQRREAGWWARGAALVAMMALGLACDDDSARDRGDGDAAGDTGDVNGGQDMGDDNGGDAVGDADLGGDVGGVGDVGDVGVDGDMGGPGGLGHCVPEALGERLGAGDWDDRFTIAGVTGQDGFTPVVHDIAADADGSVLVAGYFTWVGAEAVGPLARLRDGEWEPVLQEAPGADLSAVAVGADGRLAVSTFLPLLPVLPPVPQAGEVHVDVGEGLERVGSFQGIVRALAWVGDELWVAGHFTLADGGPTQLAVWDGEGWSAPPGGAVDGPVYVLRVEDDALLVAGSFTTVGGISAQSVASWDGEEWTAFGMDDLEPSEPFGPFRGPIVYGLTRLGGDLVAGGIFYADAASWTTSGVARFTGGAWALVGTGLAMDGGFAGDTAAVVSDVAVHDGLLYATGCFTRTGGDAAGSTPVFGLARWSGAAWEAPPGGTDVRLGDSWFSQWVCGGEPSGTAIMEAQFQRLHSDGERLYLGGSFSGVDGVASKGLVAHDGQGYVRVGDTTGLGIVGTAGNLAVGGPDCALYASGGIGMAGEASGAAVYRFDGDGWTAVDSGPMPDAGVICSELAVSAAGEVYRGCQTPWVREIPGVPRVYRLDGEGWTTLGDIPGGQGMPWGMVLDAAGRLWLHGGGAEGYLARLDGDHFTMVEDGFNGVVLSLALHPADESLTPQLVVGGTFTHIGALQVNGIARWDGASWQPLGAGVSALEVPIVALAYAEDGTIYASASSGNEAHMVLGRWDGTAWEELGTPARGLPTPFGGSVHQFYELRAVGDYVIAAGGVYPETGGRNVFVFDGEQLTALAGGVGAISIDAVALTPDALWFGGFIATTGTGDAWRPSVGIARYELGAAE
jgi:hypothetical protein